MSKRKGRADPVQALPTEVMQQILSLSDLKTYSNVNRISRGWRSAAQEVPYFKVLREADPVYTVQFSPDGKKVITGSDDGIAKVWDSESGQLILSLEGHTGPIFSAEFSRDGRHILTASRDNTVKTWDASTGRIRQTVADHVGALIAGQFSAGAKVRTGVAHYSPSMSVSNSGTFLFALAFHPSAVYTAHFSADGAKTATASLSGNLKVWNRTAEGLQDYIVAQVGSIQSVRFSPDGTKIVVSAGNHSALIFDLDSALLLHTLTDHKDLVYWADFSRDGQRIVTASWDRTAKIWDVASGSLLFTLRGHTKHVNSAQFSPDGTQIVTGSSDNTVRIWNLKLFAPELFQQTGSDHDDHDSSSSSSSGSSSPDRDVD